MTSEEFKTKWENRIDKYSGKPTILIGINWQAISNDSNVLQYEGEEAWEKIGDFYAPQWENFERTKLREWLNPKRSDYEKFIAEETQVGKIELYEEKGLIYPDFCAFGNEDAITGSMGDGSHRFIDCNYLLMNNRADKIDIDIVRLDVLCAPNLSEILNSADLPLDYKQG